jgi:hypothetical protein
MVENKLNIRPCVWRFARWNLDTCTEDTTLSSFGATLLCPVELTLGVIYGDANAPFRLIFKSFLLVITALEDNLVFRAVEVTPVNSLTLAVTY